MGRKEGKRGKGKARSSDSHCPVLLSPEPNRTEPNQWEGDVKEKLDAVRKQLDAMAAQWSRQEKDECVQETKATFTQVRSRSRSWLAVAGCGLPRGTALLLSSKHPHTHAHQPHKFE